jgi:calcium-activated chloride channel regulator 4
MKSRPVWYIRGVFIALVVGAFLFMGAFQSALAGSSWFSKARQQTPQTSKDFPATRAAGDIGTTVFDTVISLYNDPAGDDDPNNDTGTEEQTAYEEVIRFWADAVYEQSNGALRLGKVRIFRNGIYGALADVVWNAAAWPSAAPSGFGVSGRHITFGDVFTDGCGPGCDIDFLTRREEGGYTLGHEFGHYVLGLYDEYRGNVATSPYIYWPLSGDTPVQDSIMNSQWNAVLAGGGNNFRWLNHSTSNNYQANTAQGRAYGASGWEVMIREVGDDPKDGDRSTLAQRVRYTTLVGQEPTAADNWMVLELPDERNNARNELEIIWMQDDIEMQIVIDRSGSMSGDPFANAKQAAQTLVDDVENGHTALGVVSFDDVVNQNQPIVPIPDPPGTVKIDIKTVISNLTIGNRTAMFDAAKLALDNLISYAATNGTNAAQLVFLLSDGLDNESTETQATVTAAYQAADVPLSTFAYGGFAPEGVLRQMAENTGGLFRTSPTTLAEIQSAFLAVKAALTSSAAVLQETRAVPATSARSFDFAVDGTLQELSIFANYMGSSGDVDFSLVGPSGPVSGINFACTEVVGATACSAAVSQAALMAGGLGEWALVATNNTGALIDVNADILATPLPGRTYDLVVSSLAGTEVTYPNPILLTATVSQGLLITGVNISATITDPMGTMTSLTLLDTGQNGDGIANDGTYSAIVDYTMNGIYTIKVMVDNAAQTAQFTMEGSLPVHSPSATEDGEMPPPPVFPPIVENFTRTASTQALVSGLVTDDHPDSAPGTSVAPNNGDVPGRIEVSSDIDVFTVVTAGLDHLIFRVTGLALGMEPRLRILEEDGTTEIVTATIDQLVDGAAYLAVAVPVSGNADLHAEVSHATGGTGMYQFSAGQRIFSDPPLFEIDIKPGTEENPINPSSRGRIPVVILGSQIYDVGDVDVSTLAFGPDGAPASHPRGVFDDFDGDGLTDYLNHYSTSASGIALGDEEACLTGKVNDVPFIACDEIHTVP